MVLINPRGNKGTKHKLSVKTCLCMMAGYYIRIGADTIPYGGYEGYRATRSVSENTFSFCVFLCEFHRDVHMIQYENKILLCIITFSFSKLNPYPLYRIHMKREILMAK